MWELYYMSYLRRGGCCIVLHLSSFAYIYLQFLLLEPFTMPSNYCTITLGLQKGGIYMFKDFKEFAMKGNVLDLATGVIIGGAFGKIITSLVNDMIMPLIGLLLGGKSFAARQFLLRPGQGEQEDLILNYGMFIQSVVDFLIVAFSIFLFIRLITKLKDLKPKEEVIEVAEEEPEPTNEEVLLGEIRDLLKSQ